MFSKQPPRYTTADIASYVESIRILSEERHKRLTDLRTTQSLDSSYNAQRLAWRREIEDYNRDIASMQAVVNRMLNVIQKEEQA